MRGLYHILVGWQLEFSMGLAGLIAVDITRSLRVHPSPAFEWVNYTTTRTSGNQYLTVPVGYSEMVAKSSGSVTLHSIVNQSITERKDYVL